mmetsp:Transcript_105391/g.187411  ORF Transcript_105391/g.187411 Transcript_105391/m.187411 type:complete len:223 (+) Transcript_105391:304-972(+)
MVNLRSLVDLQLCCQRLRALLAFDKVGHNVAAELTHLIQLDFGLGSLCCLFLSAPRLLWRCLSARTSRRRLVRPGSAATAFCTTLYQASTRHLGVAPMIPIPRRPTTLPWSHTRWWVAPRGTSNSGWRRPGWTWSSKGWRRHAPWRHAPWWRSTPHAEGLWRWRSSIPVIHKVNVQILIFRDLEPIEAVSCGYSTSNLSKACEGTSSCRQVSQPVKNFAVLT